MNPDLLKTLPQWFILNLALVKWIAPKGAMSQEEISLQLFANLAAGGDILELRDVVDEDDVCCLNKSHKTRRNLFSLNLFG